MNDANRAASIAAAILPALPRRCGLALYCCAAACSPRNSATASVSAVALLPARSAPTGTMPGWGASSPQALGRLLLRSAEKTHPEAVCSSSAGEGAALAAAAAAGAEDGKAEAGRGKKEVPLGVLLAGWGNVKLALPLPLLAGKLGLKGPPKENPELCAPALPLLPPKAPLCDEPK